MSELRKVFHAAPKARQEDPPVTIDPFNPNNQASAKLSLFDNPSFVMNNNSSFMIHNRVLQLNEKPDDANSYTLIKYLKDETDKSNSLENFTKTASLGHQVMNDTDLVFFIGKSLSNKIWREVLFFQKCFRQSREFCFTIKFSVDNISDKVLFQRAKKEPMIIIGKIPKPASEYITDEDEVNFQEDLEARDPCEYMNYINYKLYHYLYIVIGFNCKVFRSEFCYD
jgi:hypothetical protein